MPSPSPHVPVEAIREAAKLAVEATSLRAVARAVKVSPMGLKHFLDGRDPYSATRRKLNAWYVQHASSRPEYDEAVVSASLHVLLEGVPEAGRDAASGRLLGCLKGVYAEVRATPPAWLQKLKPDE